MRLRVATAADTDQLVRLRWESSVEDREPSVPFDDFERKMRDFIAHALADARWTIWVADDGGEVVATTYCFEVRKVPRPWRNDAWGYVTGVYARPERRDSGIGTRLVTHVIERARERGLELLHLWPSERSIPFYKRLGFVDEEALALEL